MSRPRLVLASGSPRRREVLESLGLAFTVRPAELDESLLPAERPAGYVSRLAEAKAAKQCDPGEIVLAADTCVAVDGNILGKPSGVDEARRMLVQLAGRDHRVVSGVSLARRVDGDVRVCTEVVETEVEIAEMSDRELDWYTSTQEGLDKAGAYAIQGYAALFVNGNHGSYSNVVGLPLRTVYVLFERLDQSLFDWIEP